MSGTDFGPTASWQVLERRAELIARARRFFVERGYLEVETPALSRDTVIDRHLDPVVVSGGRYLQTSPEFAMKRMLVASDGPGALFQIARVFREGEAGRLHNPEFTMLEWYRVGDGVEQQLELLDALIHELLADRWSRSDEPVPRLEAPAERLSYRDAFLRHVHIDPFTATTGELEGCARQQGFAIPEGLGDDRDGWLDLLLVERVQPHLGMGRPTLLFDFPASQAALARVRGEPVPVAERFELYVQGLELANGYHELTDAAELSARNRRQNELRERDGRTPLPEASRLLDAMHAGLPACAGVAMGLDRVVMLATACERIADVIAFPSDRA